MFAKMLGIVTYINTDTVFNFNAEAQKKVVLNTCYKSFTVNFFSNNHGSIMLPKT